ncbi:MAG: hypothetical protein MI748_14425 [Opitutales bacterium]|nr:hypothetical protein [Opitutales bacterium]
MKFKLADVVEWKKAEWEGKLREVPDEEWESLARQNPAKNTNLHKKIKACKYPLVIIGELRRRNPFQPSSADPIDVVERGELWIDSGIDAISVWTDQEHFEGKGNDLLELIEFSQTQTKNIPLIYHDVILYPVQIVDALKNGASAIMLFVEALDATQLDDLYACALTADMDCIFVVQNAEQLNQILMFDPSVICINNNDIETGLPDLSICEKLLPKVPATAVSIAWGGITNQEAATRIKQGGANAVIVGNELIESTDPEQLIGLLHSC